MAKGPVSRLSVGCGSGAALAVLGLLVRLELGVHFRGYPFLSFFPAVLCATYIGGLAPGLLTAALCGILAWSFLIKPSSQDPANATVAIVFFGIVTASIIFLVDALNRSYSRVAEAEGALKALNQELEARIAERTKELYDANISLRSEAEARATAEAKVNELQRLEAVGQLTGGVAHDFNNMLAIIIGNLDLALRRLSSGETDVIRFLDSAADGARRGAVLTQRLLAFARRQPLSPIILDVNALILGMSELLRRTLGEQVEVDCALAPELWRTCADPSQLESAVLNLAVNARDAMPDGGKVVIETMNVELDAAYAHKNEGASAGEYVLIAVTDSGVGMPVDVLSRAFEPFFTTKEVGKGTGLGLSGIFGYLRQSNGHVKLYSEVGLGTTVKLYFPRYVGSQGCVIQTIVGGHFRGSWAAVSEERGQALQAIMGAPRAE